MGWGGAPQAPLPVEKDTEHAQVQMHSMLLGTAGHMHMIGGSPMRGPPQLPEHGWVVPARKGTGMGGQPGGRGPRASRTDAFIHGQQTGKWKGKGVIKVQRVRRLFSIPFPVFPKPGLQVRSGRHGLWLLGAPKEPRTQRAASLSEVPAKDRSLMPSRGTRVAGPRENVP